MSKRTKIWSAVALVVALAAIVTAGALHGNRVAASLAGRQVVGISRCMFSPAHLAGGADGVTLQLGSRSASVTPAAVSLGDARSIAIPAACELVEVRETRDGMTVAFDGVPSASP